LTRSSTSILINKKTSDFFLGYFFLPVLTSSSILVFDGIIETLSFFHSLVFKSFSTSTGLIVIYSDLSYLGMSFLQYSINNLQIETFSSYVSSANSFSKSS
jgi:hypothetical protein